MATYKEQIEVVKSYRIREGGRHRGDCPFCSGRNTFTIRMDQGELIWGCFKASCDVHFGRYTEGLSIAGIHLRAGEKQPSMASADEPKGLPIPVLTSIRNQPQALAYLKRNNALDAYNRGLLAIKYSPTEDRVMFPIYGESREAIGYIGRGRKGISPKWKKYGDCAPLLTCGSGKTAVVVEDALSACAVGVIPGYTGCSLSGTKLTNPHILGLRGYDRIMVALDPDAMALGLNMTSRLGSRAVLKLIPDDLKAFNPTQIQEILDEDYDD